MAYMLQPRCDFDLVTMDGQIYAVGGSNNLGTIEGVERFDPERNLWIKMSNLPVAKSDLAAVTVERRQLWEASQSLWQRSCGSASTEEVMERDLARGLAKGEAEQGQ